MKDRISKIFDRINRYEYVFWWLVRLCMTGAFVFCFIDGRDHITKLVISANTLLTAVIPFISFISPEKSFLSGLPMRLQTYIDIFIFFGAFIGQNCGGYSFFGGEYDKFLHLLSGGIGVLIGSEISDCLSYGSEKLPISLRLYGSAGFSCCIMVVWEIFEFLSDFYIKGSDNQNYLLTADDGYLLYRIFGKGVMNDGQVPLYDTFLDLFFAVTGCAVCSAILYICSELRRKKIK